MAFDFPAAPANGTIFNDPTSGAQYIFQNGVWMQSPGAGLPSFVLRTSFVASSSAFQYDPGTLWAEVMVVGGGGGGGSVAILTSAGVAAAGSGGGGAGTAIRQFVITPAIRAAAKNITIGGGGGPLGNGVDSIYNDGTNLLTGGGGLAGAAGLMSADFVARNGGAGGAATGGDRNIRGSTGAQGLSFGQNNSEAVGAVAGTAAGNGGSSFIGGGATGGSQQMTGSAGGLGGNGGVSPGAGASGAMAFHTTAVAYAGGGGGPGFVQITEYR